MLANGLVEEAKSNLPFRKANALQTVGYKEVFEYLDGEIDYAKDIALYNMLLKSKHASPFEHVARCMSDLEYYSFIRGKYPTGVDQWGIFNYEHYPVKYKEIFEGENYEFVGPNPKNPNIYGWCNNFRGFIPYRYLLKNS
jgi:hypothetical protein